MSMNYNRYLDLHLCSSNTVGVKQRKMKKAQDSRSLQAIVKCQRKFFNHAGREYFYEFRQDMEDQTKYRAGKEKSEGFTYDPEAWWGKGNCRNFCDVEITTADMAMLTCRNGEISDELKRMRYIGCMASIEQLAMPNLYPNLEGLVRWISDETTTNKLRINCHGSGTTTGGFSMGDAELSAGALVRALVLHGLTRQEKGKQNTFGLAHAARWKLDSEVQKCENAVCGAPFSKTWYGSTTKHHCRRCGGIFCDRCTSKRIDLRVALTGPNNATANPVKNARVCDKCFAEAFDVEHKYMGDLAVQEVFGRDAAGSELKYGLQTITLGLCMGAKAGTTFSPERPDGAAGTLAAGSLAARVRDELTQRGLRGIKITASNAVVGNDERTGLVNDFGVQYPGNGGLPKDLAGTGAFSFPAYIWGSKSSLRTKYEQLPDPKPAPGIVVRGRSIHFGYGDPLPQPLQARAANLRAAVQLPPPTPDEMLAILKTFFDQWKFTSWGQTNAAYASNRAGRPDRCCIVLNVPDRVTTIQGTPATPVLMAPYDSQIRVTGRQVDTFKLFKSYGTS
jgi:hypothetical protein